MLRARPAVLLLVLAAAVPALAAAPAGDPMVEEAEFLRREALRHSGSPRGAAALFRLHGLEDEVEDLAGLSRTLAIIASRPSAHPRVRDTAALLLMDVEKARGRLPRAAAIAQDLGFLQQHFVLGGFDNEGRAGCDKDFGPETNPSLTEKYAGAGGRELSWQKVERETPDGFVDFGAMLRPRNEAVGYAMTFLEAPKDTPTTLALGTSGGFRLWVNGELAAKSDRYNHPRPDQARVKVQLRKGLNRVLLKVCQEEGPFGFYLRHERAPGGLFPLATVLPDELPALPRGRQERAKSDPVLAELLEREVKASPKNAGLRGDWATVLAATRAFDAHAKTDRNEAARAAELAPKDARLQLSAARASSDDHNDRKRFLEAALAAEPGNFMARVMLAHHELERGHPERALPILDRLLAEHPRLAAAHVLRGRTLTTMGEEARASTLIEQALSAQPHAPVLVKEGALEALRRGRLDRAKQLLRLTLALRYDDAGSRATLIGLLADTGELQPAIRELQTALTLDPTQLNPRIRLAELLIANGRADEGLEQFAAARALSPADPMIAEREGHALLTLGRQEDALASLDRALALRPQNPQLREAIRSLRGQGVGIGESHALELAELSKEAEAFAGEDFVYLVDNTYVSVQPSGQASRFHQLALKVFTDRGVNAARSFPITFAPARQEVRILRARITKPDGSVVEAFGEADRQMNEPWSGMYYDARAKVLSFPALAKGDVLELRYRLDDTAQDNLLSDYFGDVESVQAVAPKLRFLYQVEMPRGRTLYSNSKELPGLKHRADALEDGRKVYRWEAKDVGRVLSEPGMPGWAEVAGTLHVSTYQTWDEVGRYYWGLVRDQLTPNAELEATVKDVLKGVNRKDEKAVVRAVYDFVVTNTRYVALEFGIHGYKPYRVDRVLARRFGDCKDKASLIHAMLKVAGVDSRLVLLRMRNLGSLSGTPASLAAFNHAIVYIPGQDLWLDGTAEFHGAQELPGADRLANVLIVEPKGESRFLTIPAASAEDSVTDLTVAAQLSLDGSAKLTGVQKVSGQSAPEYRRAYRTEHTRASTFERGWAQSFPGLTVNEVKVSDTTKLGDAVTLSFGMQAPRFAEPLPGNGGLRFFAFGSGRAYTQRFASLAERNHDLVLPMPWVNRSTWRFELPAGLTPAALPAPVKEETPFGRLSLQYRLEGRTLIAESEVAVTVSRVSAADYPAFRAFLSRVDHAFERRLTLGAAAIETAAR